MSVRMHEWPRRHRITVEHYYRMAEAGLFAAGQRVELIDGEIIDVPPMGARHAAALTKLATLFAGAIEQRAILRPQLPIHLGEDSEPEPDLALVKPRADHYESSHPTADDVLLLVEISDTTLRYDRDVKLALYARHAVREVWIVDLTGEQIHFYRDPVDGKYATAVSTATFGRTPIAALGVTVDLSSLARSR